MFRSTRWRPRGVHVDPEDEANSGGYICTTDIGGDGGGRGEDGVTRERASGGPGFEALKELSFERRDPGQAAPARSRPRAAPAADTRLDWAEARRPKNKSDGGEDSNPGPSVARPRRTRGGRPPSPPPPPPRTRRTSPVGRRTRAASRRTVDGTPRTRGGTREGPGRTSGPSTRPRCGGWARWGSRRSSRRASPRRGGCCRRGGRGGRAERVDASAESVFSVFFHASRIFGL